MLTGIVLAKNEAKSIAACLKSLGFCEEVLVIDDESVDETATIAKSLGAKVLPHALDGDFAGARNWALDQVKSGWVLFIDADERASTELGTEILTSIRQIEFKGFKLSRIDYMWGKQLKNGDVGGIELVRLGRKGAGGWRGRVHELWDIEGRIGTLRHALYHYPHQDLVAFLQRVNYYSTLKAEQFLARHRRTNLWEITLGPVWRFFKAYVLKFGFLDGTAGFIHAGVMSFYMFLVAGKLFLKYKGIPIKDNK